MDSPVGVSRRAFSKKIRIKTGKSKVSKRIFCAGMSRRAFSKKIRIKTFSLFVSFKNHFDGRRAFSKKIRIKTYLLHLQKKLFLPAVEHFPKK